MRNKILFLLVLLVLIPYSSCNKNKKADTPKTDEFKVVKDYDRGPVKFTIKVDKDEITLADSIKLVFEVTADKGYEVEFPAMTGELNEFSIKDVENPPSKLIDNKNVFNKKIYKLEPFLSGEYKIPILTFKYWPTGDKSDPHVLETEEIKITVKSILADDEKTKLEIKDIRGPVVPPSPNMLWLIILIVLILALGGGITWFIIDRNKKRLQKIALSFIPAHELAFRLLEKLIKEEYVEKGEYKLFYTGLSDIFRHYIENRFGLKAPESTTEEFLDSIKESPLLNPRQKELLKSFLKHCDLVKFAEYVPQTSDIQGSFDSVKNFILETQNQDSKVKEDEPLNDESEKTGLEL